MKSHSSSSGGGIERVSRNRRPSSSARSWSLSQSLLQNATAAGNGGGGLQLPTESTAAAAATPSSSTSASTTKKSVVLVKLTDAAIRALEEYVRLSNEVRERNRTSLMEFDRGGQGPTPNPCVLKKKGTYLDLLPILRSAHPYNNVQPGRKRERRARIEAGHFRSPRSLASFGSCWSAYRMTRHCCQI